MRVSLLSSRDGAIDAMVSRERAIAATRCHRRRAQVERHEKTGRRARTFVHVQLAVPARVQGIQARFQTSGHEQKLQVRLAAVLQEVLHGLIRRHRMDDLRLRERARVVLVDHQEALARRVEELGREGLDLGAVRALRLLALDAALLELCFQGRLDGRLPACDDA